MNNPGRSREMGLSVGKRVLERQVGEVQFEYAGFESFEALVEAKRRWADYVKSMSDQEVDRWRGRLEIILLRWWI